MENVKFTLDGKMLLVEIDLAHRGGLSATGKTKRIASTLGNVTIPKCNEAIKIGINCYVKA